MNGVNERADLLAALASYKSREEQYLAERDAALVAVGKLEVVPHEDGRHVSLKVNGVTVCQHHTVSVEGEKLWCLKSLLSSLPTAQVKG